MAIASIRRRIQALESVILIASFVEYEPLTSVEINAIAHRAQMGRQLTQEEVARLERQSPIVEGELLISAHRGDVFIKRYIGVDLADI